MAQTFTLSILGAPGPSAYEIWLLQGNTGTVEEYLASGLPTGLEGVTASTGVPDAGKLPLLNGVGKLDSSFLPSGGVGSGDVVGPASSVANQFVSFNGTTGKLIKDSGISLDTDTALAANSDTRLPSQKAVKAYVDGKVVGLFEYLGAVDCSANPNYPAANKGDTYVVSVAGKIGGASGTSVDVGDWYIAEADNAGGTEASVGASWGHVEHNLVGVAMLAGATFSGAVSVPDDAYDATSWNGSLQVPTKNAVRDKIELVIAGAGSYTDEQARDALGAALTGGRNATITVDDPGDKITFDIDHFMPETWNMVAVIGNANGNVFGTSFNASGGNSNASLSSGNFVTKSQRAYITTSNAANSGGNYTSGSSGLYYDNGGTLRMRFGFERAISDQRVGVGLGTYAGTADLSASLNGVWLGKDTADTTMSIFHNDGSGSCTKVSLGANFPAATDGVAYDLVLTWPIGMATVDYKVTRLDSAFVATGTLSTNLPASSTIGNANFGIGTGSGAPAGGITPRLAYMAANFRTALA